MLKKRIQRVCFISSDEVREGKIPADFIVISGDGCWNKACYQL